MGDCLLIHGPDINFDALLRVTHKLLGRNLAEAADASVREPSDVERFLSCLARFRDEQAPLSFSHLTHVSCGLLLWGQEQDVLDFIQFCGQSSWVLTETLARGVSLAVVTASLHDWRTAIASGLEPHVEPSVRVLFERAMNRFESAGLSLWRGYTRKEAPIGLYLEQR